MLAKSLRIMILRELQALDREIAAYPDDASIWQKAPGVANSGGNLTLHLCGNLRHFIGSVMTGNGYVRDRVAEFSATELPRAELRAIVADTISDLETALDKITDEHLASEFPVAIADRHISTSVFLVHLVSYLGYHLGQMDYHRRLLTSSNGSVDGVSVRELPEG
jgi:hypothetical protein